MSRQWVGVQWVGVLAAMLVCGAPAPAPAGSFTSGGQFVGSVSAQVSGLLSQFPAGGPGLRAAVAVLLEADSSLADDMAFAATTATAAQKEAIGGGFADAASFFSKCGDLCRDSERRLRLAIWYADSGTRVGYVMAATPTMSQGIPGVGNAGATTSGGTNPNCTVMSQSRPC
jgi:hypothetical protein